MDGPLSSDKTASRSVKLIVHQAPNRLRELIKASR